MKERKLVIALLVVSNFIFAGELKYPVSEIPVELKENVDVVIREYETRFKILAKNKATHYVHYVVTILNENGNAYASQVVGYNKLTKVIDFNGYVYDAAGKQIKRLKNSEVYDQAAFDGFSLYSDHRLKAVNLTQATYPYTVEFEYDLELKYLYSIPSSYFGGEKKSTQHASYQLVYPPELKPSHKLLNIENTPKVERLPDGFESVTWTFINIKPMKFEAYGPQEDELIPQIIAAPSKFEYEGYEGDMTSWKTYGQWNALLNKQRDDLPEATKLKVRELVKGLTTNEQKAKVIYEYLQSKTRYVSIQLGIGGLQPFPASLVDQTGYGDCKALSNYTVAMLKEAGVKSYYSVIQAGRGEGQVRTNFPSHQFNHVIVSVPNGRDTLWLECTSQSNPFGYQGSFTEDRYAFLITEDGGKLVRTINYSAEQNLQSRSAEVVLDIAGNAKAKIKTTNKGIQYENGGLTGVLTNQSDEQKKWIQNNTEIPNFNINSFSMVEKRDKIPSAIVTLDLTLNRYATVSGKRLFIVPNLMNRISRVPEKMTERKTDVVRSSNYLDLDTIKFIIPENIYPEFLPEPIKINSRFGEYEATYKFDEGKVIYIRRMKVWKGRFPKETYNELVDFYKNVSKADNTKLVFLNKT
jgi:transglutaminase-like putative cysteine protease